MNRRDATRCMLLTPPGAGAIAVIRVIGPAATRIVEQVFVPGPRPVPVRLQAQGLGHPPLVESGRSQDRGLLRRWTDELDDRIRYGRVIDAGRDLDDALVSATFVAGVRAFDLCVHGGVRIVERLLDLLEKNGANLARSSDVACHVWPSRNLIESEAIEALISTKSARAVRFVAWQRARLAGRLEDLATRAASDPEGVRREWEALLATHEPARRLINGATVALVGPPNSGKSTLFNRLVGREAAVVSPQAGTTRDWVSADVDLQGVPVTLMDTAGRHETLEGLERDAIARGRTLAESTDLIVLVLDGVEPTTDNDAALVGWAMHMPRVVVAINKTDRGPGLSPEALGKLGLGAATETVPISARDGTGVNELAGAAAVALGIGPHQVDDRPALFSERLVKAARSLTEGAALDPVWFSNGVRRALLESEPRS